MTDKNDIYFYTKKLTELINNRIDFKRNISKLGNEIFNLNLDIGKIKKHLAETEKEIDKTVTNFNKK